MSDHCYGCGRKFLNGEKVYGFYTKAGRSSPFFFCKECVKKMEVENIRIYIPIYSIYKTKNPNEIYQEIIKEDPEFSLVREKIGDIIIRENIDSKDYFDLLYVSMDGVPKLLGQISKREILDFFSIISPKTYYTLSLEETKEALELARNK